MTAAFFLCRKPDLCFNSTMRFAVLVLVLWAAAPLPAQPSFVAQQSNTQASLRGISAVSSKIAWASGSGGTWLRTLDGGNTWTAAVLPGGEELDFRDIEAFDANTAYLLAAGPGDKSRVYKTTDGGQHWSMVLSNRDPRGFWDCMAWWDRDHGLLVGDPVDQRFEVLITVDGGASWIPARPDSLPGEGLFAASGTCTAVHGGYRKVSETNGWHVEALAWLATGGSTVTRVLRTNDAGASWSPVATPLIAGAASAGIFSIAFRDSNFGLVVGGDYQKPNAAERNIAISNDSGKSWLRIVTNPPRGYRSAVAFVPGKQNDLVAVGTTGADASHDGGRTWQPIDSENYNAISFARDGSGWAVGPKGRIARYSEP